VVRVAVKAAGSITLGDVVARSGFAILAVACNRLDRRGQLSFDRLIAGHATDPPLSALRHIVAADRARIVEAKAHAVCGVHVLELSAMFWRSGDAGHGAATRERSTRGTRMLDDIHGGSSTGSVDNLVSKSATKVSKWRFTKRFHGSHNICASSNAKS
jgi:hypothetical protein